MSTRRFRRTFYWLAALTVVGSVGAISTLALTQRNTGSHYEKRWRPSALQVLEDDSGVWVFFEMDGVVRTSDPRVSPNVSTFATDRRIVTVDLNGKCETRRVSGDATFVPNSSRVFYYDGDFYVFQAKSASRVATLFVLKGGAFEAVSKSAVPKDIEGALSNRGAKWEEITSRLNSLSQRAGLVPCHADRIAGALDALCRQSGVRCILVREANSWHIDAVGGTPAAPWRKTIAEAPERSSVITAAEYRALTQPQPARVEK